jgi:hypothetical protein
MAGYQKLDVLLREELDQLEEEGRVFDKSAYIKEIAENASDKGKLMEIYGRMCSFPKNPSFPYNEPSEYEDIVKLCAGGNGKYTIDENVSTIRFTERGSEDV